MSIATIDIQPRVDRVEFNNDLLTVYIQDGRIVSVPIRWYPRLERATIKEQKEWRVFQDTDGRDILFWESLDELIPMVALLTGVPSRESKHSLGRWLSERKSKGT